EMSETSFPWSQYDQAFKRLFEKLDEILKQLSVIADPTKYLPVRLTDGTQFYVASGSGEGGGTIGGLVQNQIRNEADDAWINEPFERKVAIRVDGQEIDPRQIRQLTSEDVVTVANMIARDMDGHGQVDVLSLPSLPAGANKIGKVDVDNFPTEFPLPDSQISDLKSVNVENMVARDTDGHAQVDVLSLPSLPAGTNKIGKVDVDNFPAEFPLPSSQVSDLKNVDVTNLLNPHPVQLGPEDRVQDSAQFSGTYAPSAAGSTTIIQAVSGKVIRVYDYSLWNSGEADVGVRLYFGTSGKNLFKGKLAPKTGVVKSFVRPWESNSGDSLVLYLDGAGTIDYAIGAVQA
ncbi:hypothetical protein J7L13_00960, partial [bacterium]|nr:hypothetical protein [bacterium]